MLDLDVVIPAYQEERRIGSSLAAIISHLEESSLRFRVLVVDDGSADGTVEAARAFGDRVQVVAHERNLGKGAALRSGVALSRGAAVLLCDADLSVPIGELDRLADHLEHADVVIGSRGRSESVLVVRQPWFRELLGRAFNLLVRTLGVRGIRDTQCGFQLYEGEVARGIFASTILDDYAATAEALWLAQRRGYRIREIGVRWRHDPDTRVKVLSDGLFMVLSSFRFRWRHRHEPHFAPRHVTAPDES